MVEVRAPVGVLNSQPDSIQKQLHATVLAACMLLPTIWAPATWGWTWLALRWAWPECECERWEGRQVERWLRLCDFQLELACFKVEDRHVPLFLSQGCRGWAIPFRQCWAQTSDAL